MSRPALPWPHVALAMAVVAVWGTNFVVIKVALAHLPPLTLATLRFALVVLPAVFFFKRPAASWRNLAAYGVLIGAGQFGLLFLAMKGHISPGLASLVVQMQVFFTIGLSMKLTGEKIRGFQWAALGLAGAGLAVIFSHTNGDVTPLGVAMVLGAAVSWAGGNTVSRAAGPVNAVAYVVWSSIFAVPPLLVLSLIFEGWPAIVHGVQAADPATWAAVIWQSVGNSLFGYAAWSWLLSRHPAATITPMALLIPIFGMGASTLFLAEPMPFWKIAAAALVMSGLAVNLFWPMIQRSLRTAV